MKMKPIIERSLFLAVEFSKNQLEVIFDHLEPMCLVNKNMQVIRLNKAMATFLSKSYKTCLGLEINNVFSQWDHGLIESNVSLVLTYKRSIQINDYSVTDKGKKGWFEITFYPVTDPDKNVEECVVYFKNITELFLTKKILYQQYKKLEEQQSTVENQHVKLLETKEALNKMVQSLTDELNVAREVQQGIMPSELPKIPGVEFFASYDPISQVGGDIYDILELGSDKIGIFIGDVSGHGLPAAFVAAMVKMALIDHAKENVSPKELFTVINRNLCLNLKSGHYLTAFYGVLDMTDQTFLYSKASHPQPVLIRKSGEVVELDTKGMFLGLLEEPEYEERQIQLYKGDRIYFFTDGCFEIEGEKGNQLMYQDFRKILINLNDRRINTIHEALVAKLKEFSGGGSEDDRTFIAMEITQPKPVQNFPPEEYFNGQSGVVVRQFSTEQEYGIIFNELENYLKDKVESEDLVKQINVCALELANNALEHGIKWDTNKKVHIAYAASPKWVKISLLDPGAGFRLADVPNPSHLENWKRERGRGIFIVSSFMDEVYYNPKGNGVTVLKHFSPSRS